MMSKTLDSKINFWTENLSIIVDVSEFNGQQFAEWLKQSREKAGLSVTDLAEKAGVSKQYISLLEKGDDHNLTNKPVQPALDKVEQIAKVLRIPINYAREKAGYAPVTDILPKELAVSDFDGFDEDDLKDIADYINYKRQKKQKV